MKTFRELLASMPSTEGMKLPTVKQLTTAAATGSSGVAVALTTENITIYNNGFFTYTDGEYETVYAVDRCDTMAFYHGASRYEESIRATIVGCECHYLKRNTVIQAIIPHEEYMDLDWKLVLTIAGENRLALNTLWRSDNHDGRCENDTVDSIEDRTDEKGWITEERLQQVREARKTLTRSQEEIIHLYFDKGMTKSSVTHLIDRADTRR